MEGARFDTGSGDLSFERVAGLTPLEIAAGRALDPAPRRRVLPEYRDEDPVEALEALLAPAVRRSPCLVAFSGGRHSALVLWAAARAARREGVLPPIPASLRHPDLVETGEVAWQERILRHLGLGDWLRIDASDDLDLVGPVARSQLTKHGLLYPATTHALTPIVRAAEGGSLILGIGGAELPSARRFTRRAPSDPPPEWLRPAARGALRRLERAEARRRPGPAALRRSALALASARRIASLHRVDVRAPLADPRFAAAMLATPRSDRPRSIAAVLTPPPDPAPSSRRFFLWHSRGFAERWSGGGLGETLVHTEALRAQWLRPEPDLRTALALQAAWLHEVTGGRGPAPYAEVA